MSTAGRQNDPLYEQNLSKPPLEPSLSLIIFRFPWELRWLAPHDLMKTIFQILLKLFTYTEMNLRCIRGYYKIVLKMLTVLSTKDTPSHLFSFVAFRTWIRLNGKIELTSLRLFVSYFFTHQSLPAVRPPPGQPPGIRNFAHRQMLYRGGGADKLNKCSTLHWKTVKLLPSGLIHS